MGYLILRRPIWGYSVAYKPDKRDASSIYKSFSSPYLGTLVMCHCQVSQTFWGPYLGTLVKHLKPASIPNQQASQTSKHHKLVIVKLCASIILTAFVPQHESLSVKTPRTSFFWGGGIWNGCQYFFLCFFYLPNY